MSTYAPTPGFAQKHHHPRALVLIVGAHAALIAAVMVAKMDLPSRFNGQDTEVTFVPLPPEPAPLPPDPRPSTSPRNSVIDRVPAIVPIPSADAPTIDPTPLPLPSSDPVVGNGPEPVPPRPLAIPDPVLVGPRFATPPSKVDPPYPESKRQRDEEASLRLRLAIDARGRVVAVEPVGQADRTFLSAARSHILAHWRYKPATEDGQPIASSTVITLRFTLD